MIAILLIVATQVVSRDSAFLAITPRILEEVVADASGEASPGTPSRPLLINLTSFVVQGSIATGSDLPSWEVKAAFGRKFETATPGTSVQCRRRTGDHPSDCFVRQAGLYVELNYFMWRPEGYDVIVTWKQNGQSVPGFGGTIDYRVLQLRFANQEGYWSVIKKDIISST